MMNKQIVVIHGAGPPRLRRGSVYWKAKLERALGGDYHVVCPKMPNPSKPRYATWKTQIEKSLDGLEGPLILIGHSLGGSVLLKFLSEDARARPISGLFIISAPYWAKKDGWDSEEFALRKDLSGLSRIPHIFLYHSRDDEEVPFAHLARYEKKLPTATVRALAGSEHEFDKVDFPELVDDIKNLSPRVRPTGRSAPFDPSFGTAREAADAIRRRVISSRELTAYVFDRIQKHNPKLNVFVTLAQDEAMTRATQADEMLAKKKSGGPLHGVPVVVKDVFATEGVRTTSGAKELESYIPKQDAAAVARLRAAGAILVGKTNLPEYGSDWQSFNEVAGTSNNPWDVSRTPGGSTGGGASALAAGFAFLELGGDLAGSIRIPSHFCGVYGHRPTLDVVPLRGHIPPPPEVVAGPAEFPTAGPLARSAEDLRLDLEVLSGPDQPDALAYHWRLPAPRQTKLRDYRLGYVLDDPFCPVDAAVKDVLTDALNELRKSGARMTEGWPAGVDPKGQYETYSWLLAAFFSQVLPDAEFERMQRAAVGRTGDLWVKGTTSLHRDWLRQSGERLKARALWQEYFRTEDAFLMPVCFVSAFPHEQRGDMSGRKLTTTAGERPYEDLGKWVSFATLTGCPATAAPVGRTKDGLPVGLQIMGPFLEDGTTLDIAAKIAEVTGGFVPPPHFST